MNALALTAAHLGILVPGLLGFVALALASERHGEQLLGQQAAPVWRRPARLAGWLLLALSLAWAVAMLNAGIGSTLWLGWLTVAGLAIVFALPAWSRHEKPARRMPAAGVGAAGPARWLALALLLATAGGFGMLLWQACSQTKESDGAIRGAAGPWTFTLAEADRGAPEVMAMDVPMKTFTLRFCDACDTQIRQATLKVNRPRSPRAAGMAFMGQRWERKVEIPLPPTLRADSELWLTVVGKDGSVYQHAWRMDRVSPATVTWFEQRRKADADN